MFPPNKILYETFEKNGSEYECVISPKEEESGYHGYPVQFHVILKLPLQTNYIRFLLHSTADGHWVPNQKKLIDPWMADAIGRIIVENF